MRAPQLVYWSEFEEEHQIEARVLDQFFAGSDMYIVTDCYCLKPGCDCRAADLLFSRVQVSNMHADSPLCRAQVLLNDGTLRLADIGGDRVEATLITARWESRLSLFLSELKWRYHRMRGTTAAGTRRVDAPSARERRLNVHREKRKRRNKARKRK